MGSSTPLVTVVTVTLNAGEALRRTLTSVQSQTFPGIEHIVIDGGSSDGSLRDVEACRERLAFFVSEPDRGIYDAMNKGAARASGDWIIFMNAGDCFASDSVVEQVMAASNGEADFIYGDVEVSARDRRMRVGARPLSGMWRRIVFSHQSLFTRTAVMQANPFDLSFKVTADYAFYFRQYSLGGTFQHVPMTIALIAPAGFSERCLWRRTFERWRTARTHRPQLGTDLFYLKHIAAEIVPLQAKRLVKGTMALTGSSNR